MRIGWVHEGAQGNPTTPHHYLASAAKIEPVVFRIKTAGSAGGRWVNFCRMTKRGVSPVWLIKGVVLCIR